MSNPEGGFVFNPPPGWPAPPAGWRPPAGWVPDPSWPAPPEHWQLWVPLNPEREGPVEDPGQSDPDWAKGQADEHTRHEADALPGNDAELQVLRAENRLLRERLADFQSGNDEKPIELSDAEVLQSAGIYRYHHPLESAAAFKERLGDLEARIAELLKQGRAIERSSSFTFDNSVAQGERLSRDLSRLMLRAYNAEADNCLRSLRAGAIQVAKRRLERCRDSISKLGSMMEIAVSDEFHALRIEELELTADYLQRKQEEREAAREERARLREERRVERELAEQRAQLEKERAHLENALAQVRATGEDDETLLGRLGAIDQAIAENDFRAANIRAGYVYVISNVGAYGTDVVKIGLTRRLEPLERVSELSGASVPFKFDVHTLYFSEDAVSLEGELHQHFSDRALNRANPRKEFFFATPSEVRDVLLGKVGNLLEFKDEAEAEEYYQSLSYWPALTREQSITTTNDHQGALREAAPCSEELSPRPDPNTPHPARYGLSLRKS